MKGKYGRRRRVGCESTMAPNTPCIYTSSSPRYPFFSHSPVNSTNNSYCVGIKPQLKKEFLEVFGVCKKILPGLKLRLSTIT